MHGVRRSSSGPSIPDALALLTFCFRLCQVTQFNDFNHTDVPPNYMPSRLPHDDKMKKESGASKSCSEHTFHCRDGIYYLSDPIATIKY
jgi:hypothetical protein